MAKPTPIPCANCEAIKSRHVLGERQCQDRGKWWHGEFPTVCACGGLVELIELPGTDGPKPRIQNGGVLGTTNSAAKCTRCGVYSLLNIVKGRVTR